MVNIRLWYMVSTLQKFIAPFFDTGGVSFAVWEEKPNNVDHNEAVSSNDMHG